MYLTGDLKNSINNLRQASIIGKRFGRYRWSPGNPKTVEGSIAFTLSIVASACLLRVFGLTEGFSVRLIFHIHIPLTEECTDF